MYPPLSVVLTPLSPIVVINHGLTGGSHESYVRNIVVWLTKPVSQGGLGARAAVVNVCPPVSRSRIVTDDSSVDVPKPP